MAYYNRPSGASYDDPNYYRMRAPGFLTFVSIFLSLLIIIPLMYYLHIKWGWFFLIAPVMIGVLIGILNTPNRGVQTLLTWIVNILAFALTFVCVGIIGGIGAGFVAAVIAVIVCWSGLSNSYLQIRNNYSYADEVTIERKKRRIAERFKGRKVY